MPTAGASERGTQLVWLMYEQMFSRNIVPSNPATAFFKTGHQARKPASARWIDVARLGGLRCARSRHALYGAAAARCGLIDEPNPARLRRRRPLIRTRGDPAPRPHGYTPAYTKM